MILASRRATDIRRKHLRTFKAFQIGEFMNLIELSPNVHGVVVSSLIVIDQLI